MSHLHRALRILCLLALVCCLAPLQGASLPEEIEQGLRIEPSRTRIGLARVYLEVSDLALEEGELTGRYRIRVPLVPSKNDSGSIRLTPPHASGERLVGHAHSDQGVSRDVVCEILDGETIRIDVTTDQRKLTFQTSYGPARDRS